MKKIILAIGLICIASTADAGANHPGAKKTCAYQIHDAKALSIAVELWHAVDVCLPAGKHIQRVTLGEADTWKVLVGNDKDMLTVVPRNAAKPTNAIIYTDENPESRFEIRLQPKMPK